MARSSLLSCLEKRDLLNQSAVSIDKLLDWGSRYEEAGQLNDAVDFYDRAKASEQLEKLMPRVCAEGDAFLYGRILKALDREAPPQDWLELGEKAKQLGKMAYARDAFSKAGRQWAEDEPAGEEQGP